MSQTRQTNGRELELEERALICRIRLEMARIEGRLYVVRDTGFKLYENDACRLMQTWLDCGKCDQTISSVSHLLITERVRELAKFILKYLVYKQRTEDYITNHTEITIPNNKLPESRMEKLRALFKMAKTIQKMTKDLEVFSYEQ